MLYRFCHPDNQEITFLYNDEAPQVLRKQFRGEEILISLIYKGVNAGDFLYCLIKGKCVQIEDKYKARALVEGKRVKLGKPYDCKWAIHKLLGVREKNPLIVNDRREKQYIWPLSDQEMVVEPTPNEGTASGGDAPRLDEKDSIGDDHQKEVPLNSSDFPNAVEEASFLPPPIPEHKPFSLPESEIQSHSIPNPSENFSPTSEISIQPSNTEIQNDRLFKDAEQQFRMKQKGIQQEMEKAQLEFAATQSNRLKNFRNSCDEKILGPPTSEEIGFREHRDRLLKQKNEIKKERKSMTRKVWQFFQKITLRKLK